MIALVVLVVGGGGVYLATISGGKYPKLIWACALVPPAEIQSLVPHGLPDGSPPRKGDLSSSCHWSNLLAQNAGLENEDVNLTVRVERYGRGAFTSAESTAHKWLQTSGTPLSGYGDEAYRRPKAFGGEFDSIVFRDSNLDVEVAAEIDDHPGYQVELAWSRTQRAAELVERTLQTLRRR